MTAFPVAAAKNGKPRHREDLLTTHPDQGPKLKSIGNWTQIVEITTTDILMVKSLGSRTLTMGIEAPCLGFLLLHTVVSLQLFHSKHD
jgi:hypothetical protein